ncbi:glutamate--cysteine ligase [Caldichromatium japonicum]|uniref:Glutamate--cysteine ligase n=1 Tax=Caldichromatium japonicum TaxID=2699430 RepID=A0A6G7VD48_9GAMM|nr:glutamate--cysteine ligase [Caldichromatium japonicum]QIK37894.1 glutamate--cysteine ligase [Caldichromatium japonicum]
MTAAREWELLIQRLQGLGASATLHANRMGLEKEGLRVAPDGLLAQTPHPPALGAALTHPYITTDFSEALLELITPPLTDHQAVLDFLRDLHVFVIQHLGDERLWCASMPCVIERASDIPLAYYGTSNAGIMKTVYRRGLANRYGRMMQIIAGVHCNVSFADAFWDLYQEQCRDPRESVWFRAEAQIGMIRNLQRVGWLIPYLFGASPAVCESFVRGRQTELVPFAPHTLYDPYATSLRMGNIGYQNKQEEGLGMKANYDSLDTYVRSLTWAIETPCPRYEAIGVKIGERYEQLNANVLQIENEYYSTVRPKQITGWMEKPTHALRQRGIRYVELRSLDVNPFEPLGVGLEQLRFIETLMLYCLLKDSPRIDARERRDIDDNLAVVAHRGREPRLTLRRAGAAVPLRTWAHEILAEMQPIAELLDGEGNGTRSQTLGAQRAKIDHPELTPSARMLDEMRARNEGFFAFAWRWSGQHCQDLKASPLARERQALLARLADESIARQAEIEAQDQVDFDTFLQDYFAGRLAPQKAP